MAQVCLSEISRFDKMILWVIYSYYSLLCPTLLYLHPYCALDGY